MQHLQKTRGEGLLWLTRISTKKFYPEEHRDEGSLFKSQDGNGPALTRNLRRRTYLCDSIAIPDSLTSTVSKHRGALLLTHTSCRFALAFRPAIGSNRFPRWMVPRGPIGCP